MTPALSSAITSGIVFLFVLLGFAIAWMRYATANAQRDAVERLRIESERMPVLLTNLFYVDWFIDVSSCARRSFLVCSSDACSIRT